MTATLKADAGATKTDWLLSINSKTLPVGRQARLMRTQGINPVAQSQETISAIVASELIESQIKPRFPQIRRIDSLQFYGAGCIESLSADMAATIGKVFSHSGIEISHIEIGSDIIGAAKALCGHEAGIACILGTGSNSCVFDGEKIVANTPPLGFILGDEGSGAAIGRRLVNAIYKQLVPRDVARLFEEETGLRREEIINNVYRKPLAARFLASLSEFVGRHLSEYECLRGIVATEFSLFIDRNIEPYRRHDLAIGAVGGVAWQYRDILSATIAAKGYRVGRIVKSPLSAEQDLEQPV